MIRAEPKLSVTLDGHRRGADALRMTLTMNGDLTLPTSRSTPSRSIRAPAVSGPLGGRGQGSLRRELARLAKRRGGKRLGDMYAGGRRVMADDSNPDRLAQSAHSMRELLEKFGDLSDLRRSKGQSDQGLENKVQQLRKYYYGMQELGVSGPGEPGWSRESLQDLLAKLEDFFAWCTQERATLWEQTRDVANTKYPQVAGVPEYVPEDYRDLWRKCRRYFVEVCHHQEDPDMKSFLTKIAELETFFLNVPVIKVGMGGSHAY